MIQGELAASNGQLESKARETATLNSKVELLQEEVESMTRQVSISKGYANQMMGICLEITQNSLRCATNLHTWHESSCFLMEQRYWCGHCWAWCYAQ